jgi:hypothetical protein
MDFYLLLASVAYFNGGFPSESNNLLEAEPALSDVLILLAGLAYLTPLPLSLEGDFIRGVGGFELFHLDSGSASICCSLLASIFSKIRN